MQLKEALPMAINNWKIFFFFTVGGLSQISVEINFQLTKTIHVYFPHSVISSFDD
jgi:hypothetical protein